jgi:hypothetical protein
MGVLPQTVLECGYGTLDVGSCGAWPTGGRMWSSPGTADWPVGERNGTRALKRGKLGFGPSLSDW